MLKRLIMMMKNSGSIMMNFYHNCLVMEMILMMKIIKMNITKII